jgi:hypothetical protein
VTDISQVIAQLDQQKTAIENAIEALREVTGQNQSATHGRTSSATSPGRQRQIAAMKRYWARKKAAEGAREVLKSKPHKTATRKRGLTPEGRKHLAENMRRRWAVKRAAAKKRT